MFAITRERNGCALYFVDREVIEKNLQYLEQNIALFKKQADWTTPIEKAALERIVQMMLEAVLDVGNAMIDGFIMRDPGSYEDIVDILNDENVITAESATALKKLISYRKMLVQMYTTIDHAQVQAAFSDGMETLAIFPQNIRAYLTNELGPVSAFKTLS